MKLTQSRGEKKNLSDDILGIVRLIQGEVEIGVNLEVQSSALTMWSIYRVYNL